MSLPSFDLCKIYVFGVRWRKRLLGNAAYTLTAFCTFCVGILLRLFRYNISNITSYNFIWSRYSWLIDLTCMGPSRSASDGASLKVIMLVVFLTPDAAVTITGQSRGCGAVGHMTGRSQGWQKLVLVRNNKKVTFLLLLPVSSTIFRLQGFFIPITLRMLTTIC